MKHIQIILHESCNNHCAFCYYNNKNVIPKLPKLNPAKYSDYDIINFIGGELCHQYYPGYFDELLELIKKFIPLNKHIIISTNLLSYDFLYQLLKELKYDNLSIGTSYDYTGRFTKHQKMLFFQNVERLRNDFNYKLNCNLILTKSLLSQFNRNDFILFDNLFFMPLEINEAGKNTFYENNKIAIDDAVNFLHKNWYSEEKYVSCDCNAYEQFNHRLDRSKSACGHFKHLSIDGKCLLCRLKEKYERAL